MVDVPISAEVGVEIARWCMSQVRVLWVHQGRKPGQGLDCVGLPVCAARAAGHPNVVDVTDYSEYPSPAQLLECVMANCLPVDGPGRAGDLLLLWLRRPEEPRHAAVDIGNGRMVHATRRKDGGGHVVLDDVGRWSKHLHSRWRLKRWHS